MARENDQIWVKEEKRGWRKFEKKGLSNTSEYTVLFEHLAKWELLWNCLIACLITLAHFIFRDNLWSVSLYDASSGYCVELTRI